MSKVSSIADKVPKCSYCGLAPATEHPDYTCPRIESVSWEDGATQVSFCDPATWQAYLEGKNGDSED